MQLLSIVQSSGPYESLIVLGAIIVAGLFMGGIVEKIKIPYITGYILSGLIIGGVLVLLKFDYLIKLIILVMSVYR